MVTKATLFIALVASYSYLQNTHILLDYSIYVPLTDNVQTATDNSVIEFF